MAIYGRSGLSDWTLGTATVANGSASVTVASGQLISTDATTGATLYAAGRGDLFVVQGVGAKFISSVDSTTGITLVEPWTYASQTSVAYAIIRMSFPATGSVAKALTDLYNQGTDTLPDLSRTIDDTTARIKIKSLAGVPGVSVGPSGTADASLKQAIAIDKNAGTVSFPQGAQAPSDWQNNRFINGGFDIWQTGTTFSIPNSNSTYTADQWLVANNSTGVTLTATRALNTTNFSGRNGINISGTGVAANSSLGLAQKFEGSMFADTQGTNYPFVVSFDIAATTSAGNLTSYVQFATNTTLDDGTMSNYNTGIFFTIPVGGGRVSVPMTAAACANIWRGGFCEIVVLQNGVAGNVSVTLGAVQIERGVVATPWAPKPIARVLANCQRYFSCSWGNLSSPGASQAAWIVSPANITNGNLLPILGVPFPVQMRVTPTLTLYDVAGTAGKIQVNFTNGQTASANGASPVMFNAILNSSGSSIGAGISVIFHWSASARL